MTEEAKVESPTIEPEQKTSAQVAQPPAGEIDYKELVTRLEQVGVTTPKQLDGKLQAAQERGHLANLLGEMKNENAELKRMLMDMQTTQKQRNSYEDEPRNAGAIDIGELIEQKLSSAIQREKKASLEQQMRSWQAWQTIQGDDDYHLVKDQWEARMRDPNFAIQLQAGAVDPHAEYRELVRANYKRAIRTAAETIKSLTTGAAPPNVHVENSARVSASKTETRTETDKKIGTLKDKARRGELSEEEQLEALTAVLMGGANK